MAAVLGGYWYVQQQKVDDLQQQIDQLPSGKDRVSLVKDRITLENTIAGSMVQSIGGLLLFVTAWVSIQNLKATQRNVLVAEEKQVTERFTQAINQLGSDKIEVRLGGIYALERIARDSEKDHWTIMEVLTSFVQEKSASANSDPTIERDIQAALTVIGRRDTNRDPDFGRINLMEANLFGATMSEAQLDKAIFCKAVLNHANLWGANLNDVNFLQAHLIQACLAETNLVRARLSLANLGGTDLTGANLNEVRLDGANLSGANLSGASLTNANLLGANLIGANFYEANLSGAKFGDANMDGARFNHADLSMADFQEAKNLVPGQVEFAKNYEKAQYDPDLRQQLGLPPEQKP